MKIQLIRHATCLIWFKDKTILLDPMLSPAGTLSAIPDVPNEATNPLVDLPDFAFPLNKIDAILLTHTHRDHFDNVAIEILPKNVPVFCQPQDIHKIQNAGFQKVNPITDCLSWENITLYRTGGQHGSGEIGQKMGPVSGFVLKANLEPILYITGDSIWCDEVQATLEEYQPKLIVCNAGGAQFHEGAPITMTLSDIDSLSRKATSSKIIAVHMEAWNHCRLSREKLKIFLEEKLINDRVYVPNNGDVYSFE